MSNGPVDSFRYGAHMTFTDDALATLSGPRWKIAEAPAHVPDRPGLYAIYGDDEAWSQLAIERRPDDLLYVGKAEDSLVSRELRGHFAIDLTRRAQTGSSTVRRSFAALLRDSLGLHGVPRNTAKPGHFSNDGCGGSRLDCLSGRAFLGRARSSCLMSERSQFT